MSTKSFKDTMLYPIVFMLVMSIVFVGVLAVMYRGSQAKIEAYKKETYQKMVLSLLATSIGEATNTKPFHINADYPNSYNQYVKEITFSGLDKRVFIAEVDAVVLGYCVDISGKGLWGTMRALVALSPDFKTLHGISIYDQMETPGLGARIGEDWFVNQFNNFPILKADGKPGDYVLDTQLIPEDAKAEQTNQIRQITGATITTFSVIKMLQSEINLVYAAYLRQAKL
ncbi:MAG: FMN-binding protein [Candidatus Cloacimonetes bacterium]|nr:FMN-binding protein [Candidatus Cloacimonadota bacterium]